jgi:AhpC/TSA family
VVKRWYGKYHPYGFDVIGVHYGEFNIGFDIDNVRAAAREFRLPWPVVADQKGTTWKAYGAQGWPDRYLVDPQGNIVMQIFGGGHNREMEAKIRELLAVSDSDMAQIELDPEEDDFRPECGSPPRRHTLASCAGEAPSRTWPATTRARLSISSRRIPRLTVD